MPNDRILSVRRLVLRGTRKAVENLHTWRYSHRMSSADPSPNAQIFERALKTVLRPMMRMLISKGIAAPAFYRVVKQTYVETAVELLGRDATDSRISVMTGVHRRDVKEFRDPDRHAEESLRRKVSTLTSVVGRWLSDPVYANAQGAPVAIKRSGQAPSFDALVQSVSRDVRPRTILDELIRQDIVYQTDDLIALDMDVLVGPADTDQRMHFFAHNLGDHMAAAVENLLEEQPKLLERAVFYNHLTASSVDKLEAQARSLSQDTLLKINKLAADMQSTDKVLAEGKQRFRYGVFFYKEDESEAPKGNDPQ